MFCSKKILHRASLLCTGLMLTCSLLAGTPLRASAEQSVEERLELQRAMPIDTNEIQNWPTGPVVSAESAILMEADSGTILYAKNIHQREYPASTTKILTTLLATELCRMDELVTFSKKAVFDNPPGSSGIAMDVGQALTVEQCLNAILIRSANEVAFALAEHITGTSDWSVFAEIMNKRAAELGALDTHFVNPNGLPDENHYTTAYDLAMIGRGFFANQMLCDISITRRMELPASEYLPEAKIENSSMQIIPGGKYAYEYLIGCKTGYTNVARSSLVSCAEKDGLKLICVVMKDESPLQYEDTIALFNYGFSNFKKCNVAEFETRYNIDSTGLFYKGNDLFGSSESMLTLNKTDCIILPKTAALSDTVSTISYDTGDDTKAALIHYTFNGAEVGTAGIEFTQTDAKDFGFEVTDESEAEEESVIFVNVLKVLAVVLIAALVIGLILLLLRLRPSRRDRGYLGNPRRDSRRRRRRRRRRRDRDRFRGFDL